MWYKYSRLVRFLYEVAEGGLAHKIRAMVGRYTDLTVGQIRDAFQKMFLGCSQEKSDVARANERNL